VTSIDAQRVFTPEGWTGPVRVEVDAGVVTAIDVVPSVASDRTLVPGFIDLQVNGIDDVDVSEADGADWERLDRLLLQQGVTSWCPTLITAPLYRYAAPLDRIAAAMRRPAGGRPTIVGAHLEGPFLGGAPGAHPRRHLAPIDLDWLANLPPHVAVVTLGAELADAEAAIRLLSDAGRLVSLGHTTATAEQVDAAAVAGARLATHLFNGMSGVHHRDPGVATFVMTNHQLSASLIADGVHVHPRVLALAWRALGPDRAVLVTDAVGWRAGNVGSVGIELRDGAPRLGDGTLAGSALTMDGAVRQCVAAGIELHDVVRAASSNPARLLGLPDRGVIAVGHRADLVALSPTLDVEQVWVAGEPVR